MPTSSSTPTLTPMKDSSSAGLFFLIGCRIIASRSRSQSALDEASISP